MMILDELQFRKDAVEGGMVIEYQVDGRKRTQTVPWIVGQILEAVVRFILEDKENERSTVIAGRDGGSGAGSGPVAANGPKRPGRKAKAKANT
jgi:hypothetical protein